MCDGYWILFDHEHDDGFMGFALGIMTWKTWKRDWIKDWLDLGLGLVLPLGR